MMTAFRIPVALLCAAGLALFTPSPALAQKIKPGGGQAYPYTLVDLLVHFAQREAIRVVRLHCANRT